VEEFGINDDFHARNWSGVNMVRYIKKNQCVYHVFLSLRNLGAINPE